MFHCLLGSRCCRPRHLRRFPHGLATDRHRRRRECLPRRQAKEDCQPDDRAQHHRNRFRPAKGSCRREPQLPLGSRRPGVHRCQGTHPFAAGHRKTRRRLGCRPRRRPELRRHPEWPQQGQSPPCRCPCPEARPRRRWMSWNPLHNRKAQVPSPTRYQMPIERSSWLRSPNRTPRWELLVVIQAV